MSYVDIDGSMYSRSRSYELVPMAISPYVTREELADAKKELIDLRRKKVELLEEIERKKKERDERISAGELQDIMFPVENVVRRIEELSFLVINARIVEKSTKVQPEEIQEALLDENIIIAEEGDAQREGAVSNDTLLIPEALFFVKDGVKVEAKPGNRTPFYALVEGEYIGFNRLVLNGWKLVDDADRTIKDNEAWDISKKILGKERASFIQSAKNKYPNAFAPWTDEENKKLIDLYSNQGKTLAEISAVLGRTKNGISFQIKRLLGLERLPYRKKQKDLDEYTLSPITITSINPVDIPDDQMPGYLDMIEQMEEWFKYVKDYAEQQAIENGVFYDGYEIKTAYKNSYSNPQKVIETIQTKFPNLYSSCVQLKTVSALKKALGEDNYNSSIAELVELKEQKILVKSKQ